jgi:hypothetical protein
MSTETQNTPTQQQLIAARALAHIRRMPQFKTLNWFTREALRLKLGKTNGNLIQALSLISPRESYENNSALAQEILSHPDVACLERELGVFFEDIERENAATGSKS